MYSGNNNWSSVYAFKIFIYILGIFRAIIYTPVVLSFIFFIVFIPTLFQSDFANPLFRLVGDGHYTTADILSIYGKYAFAFSLLISLAEIILQKRLTISVKKKMLLVIILLLAGYCFILIFFIVKTELNIASILPFLILAFTFSFFAVLLNALLEMLINLLNQIIDGHPRSRLE